MMRVLLSLLLLLMTAMLCSPLMAADSARDVRSAKSKPVIRGGIVFRTYCSFCHGQDGKGNTKAAKLYDRKKLMIKSGDTAYYEKITREGGEAIGKSKFMPPWRDELSEEQIKDVVAYLGVLNDQIERGRAVFLTNCILCHGVTGNGKGRASVLYDPPPANLIKSDKNEEYMRSIITMGGKAMGRSEVMPIWGEQITAEEIEDVLQFVRKVIVENPR
ncbi:MAG: c-type cytochrome [Gammaproteobacteria bacterium]|nr:c-type cytochrome [Gammaproteobacteria bacterium]